MLTFWKYFWLFFPLLQIIIINKYWNGSSSSTRQASFSSVLLFSADAIYTSYSYLQRLRIERRQSPPWEVEGLKVGVGVWLIRKEFCWFPLSRPLLPSTPDWWLFLHVITLSFLNATCDWWLGSLADMSSHTWQRCLGVLAHWKHGPGVAEEKEMNLTLPVYTSLEFG